MQSFFCNPLQNDRNGMITLFQGSLIDGQNILTVSISSNVGVKARTSKDNKTGLQPVVQDPLFWGWGVRSNQIWCQICTDRQMNKQTNRTGCTSDATRNPFC